jgi:hypothetical protein
LKEKHTLWQEGGQLVRIICSNIQRRSLSLPAARLGKALQRKWHEAEPWKKAPIWMGRRIFPGKGIT